MFEGDISVIIEKTGGESQERFEGTFLDYLEVVRENPQLPCLHIKGSTT